MVAIVELVVFTIWPGLGEGVKLKLEGETLTREPVPLPVIVIVCVVGSPLSVMVRVAFSCVVRVGVNFT